MLPTKHKPTNASPARQDIPGHCEPDALALQFLVIPIFLYLQTEHCHRHVCTQTMRSGRGGKSIP